jgi:g-D-glutamyl-meso-diaminopimelate peptidase
MKTLIFLVCFILYCPTAFANVVNPAQTYTYKQMELDIQQLQEIYGDAIEVKTIGKTHFGLEIPAIKLGEGQQNVLLVGSHHGREWITTSLLMTMLEAYVKAYTNGTKVGTYETDLLKDVSIWFVPMINPDGVQIQQQNVPLFFADQVFLMNDGKGDFSRWKANGVGVDLNRQYPAGWNSLGGPRAPSFQFYKGRSPLSAMEVQAITSFVDSIQPSIAVAYHSTGQEIYWNYHNGKNKQRDYSIANEIAELTGYQLARPPKKATGGGFTDWFITKYHRPALTIEVCPPMINSAPPLSAFPEVWERNQYVGLKLVEKVKNLHKSKEELKK